MIREEAGVQLIQKIFPAPVTGFQGDVSGTNRFIQVTKRLLSWKNRQST